MVLKLFLLLNRHIYVFENDVKMYGTQTEAIEVDSELSFENDVKMYGTQTSFFL